MASIDGLTCAYASDLYEIDLADDGATALLLHHVGVLFEDAYDAAIEHVAAMGYAYADEFGGICIPYEGDTNGLWGDLEYVTLS